MKINRDTLYIGLLTKTTPLTLSYPRKALFSYDMVSQTGYDVINDHTYSVHEKNGKDKFHISYIYCLGSILGELGYPEILEDVHIERIMEEDFEKVFMDSMVIQSFHIQTMEKLRDLHYENNYEQLKLSFKKTDAEKKEEAKSQRKCIIKGWF